VLAGALIIVAALIVAVSVAWGARTIAGQVASRREEERRGRVLTILDLFAPAIAAVQQEPRALLVWQPLARSARRLFPEEFAAIDQASGGTFPFGTETLQSAHARWTADWLAWERSHDAACKRKALEVEHDAALTDPMVRRARLDAIEQEKLELYQRRYEEYVRVAKSLQSLIA
jgi:hypothetical protein